MKETKIFSLIFLLGIYGAKGWATDFEKKIFSPEVASFCYDIERPVAKSTGTLGIDIPIYTCKTQNITVPISLYFNTSGIKHTQKASSVGLGWGLKAGGFITRVVKGLPDEMHNGEFLGIGSPHIMDGCFSCYSTSYRGIQTFYDSPSLYNCMGDFYVNGEFSDSFLLYNTYGYASYFPTAKWRRKYYIDQEPDVYYYNFGNYQGSFVLDPEDGTPVLFPYSNIRITPILVADSASIDKWEVVTPDGLKYIFEEKEKTNVKIYSTHVADIEELDSKEEDYISAWKLTKINNQNTQEKIEFRYQKQTTNYEDHTTCIDTYYIDNELIPDYRMYLNNITIKESLIDEISFNGNKVKFNYSDRDDIENTQKIETIKVYNKSNSNILSYRFNYDYYSSESWENKIYPLWGELTLRLKLNSISQYTNSGELLTEFDYYYPDQFRAQNWFTAISTDHWGYSNTQTALLLDMLDNYSYDALSYFSYKDRGNPLIGLLKEIKYPTGGNELFEYQKNSYYDEEEDEDKYAGGARIYKITKDYRDGKETQKIYSYETDGHSSGTIFQVPEYLTHQESHQEFEAYANKNDLFYEEDSEGYTFFNNENEVYIPETESEDVEILRYSISNHPGNSVNDLSGNNVCYSRVTERILNSDDIDIGYNEYFFTSFADHPDENSTNYVMKWSGSSCGDLYTCKYTSIENLPVYGIYARGNYYILGNSTYKGWERGLLTKQNTYNRNDELVRQVKNEYDFDNFVFDEVKSTEATLNDDNTILVSKFKYISAQSPLKKTTNIDYSDNDSICSISFYEYNNYGQVSQKSIINSNEKNITTVYKYPFDINIGTYASMDSLNIINSPIEQTTFVNNTVTKSTLTTYNLVANSYFPEQVYTLETISSIPSSSFSYFDGITMDGRYGSTPETEFVNYDSEGNLLEYKTHDGITVSFYYLPDYSDNPIIKAINITYEQLESAIDAIPVPSIGAPLCQSFATTGEVSVNDIKTIVIGIGNTYSSNLAQVIGFTYKPLIGMTSQTAPNGTTTYYDYDDFGRLKHIKNDDDDIVKRYAYHYQETGPPFSINTTNLDFSTEGGSSSFTISTGENEPWQISGAAGAFTIDNNSGTGNATITISCSANITTQAQVADLKINYGTDFKFYKTLRISQEGLFLNIQGARDICSGGSVSLYVSTNLPYFYWNISGNPSESSITVSPAQTTSYTVTGYLGGNIFTASATINVISEVTVNTNADTLKVCSGFPATISVSGNGDYYILEPGGQRGTSFSVSPAVSTVYTVTGYRNDCDAVSTSKTVFAEVLPSPVVTACTDQLIAPGESATLTASGADSYTWEPGGIQGNSINVSPLQTTTYTVKGRNSYQCESSDNVTVFVNNENTLVVCDDKTICAGSSVELTAMGALAYSWSPGNFTGASIEVAPGSTTTYTVTGTLEGNITTTEQVTVTVINAPVIAAGEDQTICSGELVTLTASGADSYTWEPGGIPGTSISVSPTETTTYTVTGKNESGCSSTDQLTVEVNQKPVLTVTEDQIIDPGAITVTASGADSYVWSPGTWNGNTFNFSCIYDTKYTVVGTNNNGCSATKEVNITVRPLIWITTDKEPSICSGDNITLRANGRNERTGEEYSYVWLPGNMQGSSVIVSPAQTTTYTVTATDSRGLTTTKEITVKVATDVPNFSVAPIPGFEDLSICPGDQIIMKATGDAYKYNWTPSTIEGDTFNSTLQETTNFNVIATNGCGTSTQNITVNVKPQPVFATNLIGESQSSANLGTVCSGDELLWEVTSGTNDYYQWNRTLATGNSFLINFSNNGNEEIPIAYSVAAYKDGCFSTKELSGIVRPKVNLTVTADAQIIGIDRYKICQGESVYFNIETNGDAISCDKEWTYTIRGYIVQPNETTTYTIITEKQGWCSTIKEITIEVVELPNMTIVPDQAICEGESTEIWVTGDADRYTWPWLGTTDTSLVVSPTTSSNYHVYGFRENCYKDLSTIVTVNPAHVSAGADQTVCYGESVTLTASAGEASYQWMPGNLSGQSVTVSPEVSTTYYLTATSPEGCVSTDEVVVTVNPLPVITTSGDISICAGESVTLSVEGEASVHIWNDGEHRGASYTVAPDETTSFKVRSYTPKGCYVDNYITVTVNPVPDFLINNQLNSIYVICKGESITLSITDGNADYYTWQPGDHTGSEYTVSPEVSTTYTVTAHKNGCEKSKTAQVNVQRQVTAGEDKTICLGETVTLAADNCIYYSWSPGNVSDRWLTVSPTETTTYTVTGSHIGLYGCPSEDQVTVNVIQPPGISFFPEQPICEGESATLTAGLADSYLWTPGNFTSQTITVTPTETTTYTLTDGIKGCTHPWGLSSVTVTVNPVPVVSAGADKIICLGQTAELLGSPLNMDSYSWTGGGNTHYKNVSPTETTTYTLTGTKNNCSASDDVTVTVVSSDFTISGNTTICAGSSTTLTASGDADYYIWEGLGTGASKTVSPASTTTYRVTGYRNTYGSMTCPVTKEITVTVNTYPTVATSGDVTICSGEMAFLYVTGDAMYYQWEPGNYATSPEYSYNVSPTETTTYTVTAHNGDGCVSTASLTVTVNPTPSITTENSVHACYGQSTTLTVTGDADSYSWYPGDYSGTSCTVTPVTNTVYSVTGTNNSGCSVIKSIQVLVDPVPSFNISGNATINEGESTTLVADGNASLYTWMPGNYTGSSFTVNPTNTTTYTATGSFTNGCSVSKELTVTVKHPPVISASSDVLICLGESATLSVSGNAISYVWNPGNHVGNTLTVTPDYTTNYTVTGTAADGSTSTDLVLVTVNQLPTLSAGNNVSICTGGSTTLTARGNAASYTWNPGNYTGTSYTVSPTVTTTYTLTGTSVDGCTSSSTVTVTVNSLPTVSAGNNVSICAGGSTTLNAIGNAASYYWNPGNHTGASYTVSPTTTTTYTLTGTSAGGCTSSSTVTVTVNPLPTVSAGNNVSICPGENTTLTASGNATSYTWNPGNNNGASYTVTPWAKTTYTVTGTSSEGCTSSSTVTVTVNSLPSVSAGNDVTICPGGSTTLTASGNAASYTWSPGNHTGTSYTVSPTATTTYTLTGTSADGCTSSSTVTVIVNPSPTVSAGNNVSICAGGSTTLNASGNAVNYTWTPGNHTGTSYTVSPTATTAYTLTGTATNGCTSSSTVTVTVNPSPTVSAGNNVSICAGASTTLTASGNAASYTWSPGNYTGTSYMVSPTATTTYTVTGTSDDGCTSSSTVTVTVNPLPTVSAGNNVSICAGGSTTLTASGNAASYTWSPGNYTGTSYTVSPTATTTYTVTGTSADGCTSSSTVTVTVNLLPSVSAGNNVSICAGASTTLTASGNAASYTWSPGNYTGTSYTVSPTATTTYTVTGTSADGCTSSSTVTVTVNPLPTVSAGNNVSICAGASTTLTASGNAASYTWNPGNYTGTSYTVSPTATTTYTVTGTSADGCTSSSTVTVTVISNNLIISASEDVSVCKGHGVYISVTGNADTYNWSSGQTGTSVLVYPESTTTYTVTGTNSAGCSITDNVTVSVKPRPTYTVTVSPEGTVCGGEAVTITATGDADAYYWNPYPSSTESFTIKPTNTVSYTSRAVKDGCLTTGDDVTIDVTPLPYFTITSSATDPVCSGTSVTLTASNYYNYTWEPGGITGRVIQVNPTTTTTYTATALWAGCEKQVSITVPVIPMTDYSVTLDKGTITYGEYSILRVSGSVLGNTSIYVLKPNGSYQYITSMRTYGGPITQGVSIEGTYKVYMTNDNGCMKTLSAQPALTVNPGVKAVTYGTIFSFQGGTGSITVSSDTNWTVTTDCSWLVPSQTSGSGNANITFNCLSYNYGGDYNRYGNITFSAGSVSKTITITQWPSNSPGQ